jgi:hypothetical protein
MDFLKRLTGFSKPRSVTPASQTLPSEILVQSSTFPWPQDLKVSSELPHAVMRIFPGEIGRVVIIIPGYKSSGKKPKYEDVISQIQDRKTAVISTNNPDPYNTSLSIYAETLRTQLFTIIDYLLAHPIEISGRESPGITLYGSSAGGGVAALVAGFFPKFIDSVILTGPSQDVLQGLEHALPSIIKPFTGKTFLIRTEDDQLCTTDTTGWYQKVLAEGTFQIKDIPGDDHAFDSPENHAQLLEFIRNTMDELTQAET